MRKKQKKLWIPVISVVILAMIGIIFVFQDNILRGNIGKNDMTMEVSKGNMENMKESNELTSENPFGDNVYVFSPKDNPTQVQQIIDETWASQETNQFGEKRVTFFFMPGEYDKSIEMKVGYYTQVAGLGVLPTDNFP